MNNYNSEWRIWAKIVAIIDMIFVVLLFLGTLLLIFFAGAATAAISDINKAHLREGAGVVTWIPWFVVAIFVIQTGIGLWATVQLLKATELGRESQDAYKLSKHWQYVCFVFIVFDIIGGILTATFIWTTVCVLIRIIFMYIVYRFMQEVQVYFITTPHQMTQNV